MAAPASGVCGDWIDDVPVSCCSDATKRAQAVTLSTALLFRFSGRQFPGICERTVRPCSGAGCGTGRGQWPASWDYAIWDAVIGSWTYSTPTTPALIGGNWFNLSPCSGECSLPAVRVPGPVVSVDQIVIDGVVLDPSAYKVAANREIVRVDGGTWPCRQSYGLNSAEGGDVGTWQITYHFGRGPGPDGVIVAELFACEIAKYLCGSDCVLPARLKELTREGVGIILDPLTHIENHETGIPLVDSWLVSVNPSKLQRRSVIRRLDVGPRIGKLE